MKPFRMLGRSIRDALKSVIRNFSLSEPHQPNPKKCKFCIYNHLCDINIKEDE